MWQRLPNPLQIFICMCLPFAYFFFVSCVKMVLLCFVPVQSCCCPDCGRDGLLRSRNDHQELGRSGSCSSESFGNNKKWNMFMSNTLNVLYLFMRLLIFTCFSICIKTLTWKKWNLKPGFNPISSDVTSMSFNVFWKKVVWWLASLLSKETQDPDSGFESQNEKHPVSINTS